MRRRFAGAIRPSAVYATAMVRRAAWSRVHGRATGLALALALGAPALAVAAVVPDVTDIARGRPVDRGAAGEGDRAPRAPRRPGLVLDPRPQPRRLRQRGLRARPADDPDLHRAAAGRALQPRAALDAHDAGQPRQRRDDPPPRQPEPLPGERRLDRAGLLRPRVRGHATSRPILRSPTAGEQVHRRPRQAHRRAGPA